MTARDLIVDALLAAGVGAELICCIGVVVMRNAFDRLHYAGAATTIGPILVGAAVLVRESVSAGGLQTVATVAVLFLLSPVVQIATARAARRIEYGRIDALAGERVE
ncbi:MAG: cation:proton antiporter [Gaiellaceae bacterium]